MIYLVTHNTTFFEDTRYQPLTVSEALTMLYQESILGIDTETNGLKCHSNDLKINTIR